MTKVIGIVLVQVVALLGLVGPAPAEGGNQRFFAAGRVEDPSIVIAGTGVIGGVGSLTAESVDFRPADNTYRETDLADLGAGTLTLEVNGRFSVWPFTLDPRTCTRHGTLGGTWTIVAAAGKFTGARGGGTFSGRFFTYSSRGPAGCDLTAIKGFVSGSMNGEVRV